MEEDKEIPQAAWKRKLCDNYPDHSEFQVAMLEGMRLAGLGFRLYKYIGKEADEGRLPIMNPFKKSPAGPRFGVPLGGLGAGTINRGWRGDFGRWYLQQGFPNYTIVDANAFSVFIGPREPGGIGHATVLTTAPAETNKCIRNTWEYHLTGEHSTYHALFPRAWTEYREPDPAIRLVCKQVTPVIPHNYKESSYPCGVFEWTIENSDSVEREISLMMTWQNGTGGATDYSGGHTAKLFSRMPADGRQKVMGISMIHENFSLDPVVEEMQQKASDELREGFVTGVRSTGKSVIRGVTTIKDEGRRFAGGMRDNTKSKTQKKKMFRAGSVARSDKLSFAIACRASDPAAKISYNTGFYTTDETSTGRLWSAFNTKGELRNDSFGGPSREHHAMGVALCAKVVVKPGQKQTITFSLSWDLPIVRFFSNRGYYRRYTKFYDRDGNNEERIAVDALNSYRDWERQIEAWQRPVLEDPLLPTWYKNALFNELYYLTEGGTVWTHGEENEPPDMTPVEKETYRTIGKFGYLESMEYIMVNTYDVHFYASWALAMLWPKLELSLQCDFGRSALEEYPDVWTTLHSSHKAKRKVRAAVPHDLGNPGDDPWYKVNSYNIQPINDWKDLNCKFALQVYRDFVLTKNKQFLEDNFVALEEALERVSKFDRDGDGLIENEGFPDQTYDTWSATGASAYSGGLWVVALAASAEICNVLGYSDKAEMYMQSFKKARSAYHDRLWNGKYYNYDTSTNVQHDSIMADMLCGQWYARACQLPNLDQDESCLATALSTIFRYNVLGFKDGKIGAVNGMRPDGKIDKCCLQSVEVWTGTTFGLASTMMQEGLIEEGFQTAFGIVNTTYEDIGYHFQTPEAWDSEKHYRAIGYMRPLAIWGMQYAWDNGARDEKARREGVPVQQGRSKRVAMKLGNLELSSTEKMPRIGSRAVTPSASPATPHGGSEMPSRPPRPMVGPMSITTYAAAPAAGSPMMGGMRMRAATENDLAKDPATGQKKIFRPPPSIPNKASSYRGPSGSGSAPRLGHHPPPKPCPTNPNKPSLSKIYMSKPVPEPTSSSADNTPQHPQRPDRPAPPSRSGETPPGRQTGSTIYSQRTPPTPPPKTGAQQGPVSKSPIPKSPGRQGRPPPAKELPQPPTRDPPAPPMKPSQ